MGQLQDPRRELNGKNFRDAAATAFASVPRPADRDYTTDAGGEGLEESSAFFGKDWRGLMPDFLHTYRDVLFWFTPSAFHYYLPAFLCASLDVDVKSSIYVDTLLRLLRADAEDSFSRERWGRLSEEQIGVLEDWLDWLALEASSDPGFARDVSEAREAVRERYWWIR